MILFLMLRVFWIFEAIMVGSMGGGVHRRGKRRWTQDHNFKGD